LGLDVTERRVTLTSAIIVLGVRHLLIWPDIPFY
jgi:hypothetical protein